MWECFVKPYHISLFLVHHRLDHYLLSFLLNSCIFDEISYRMKQNSSCLISTNIIESLQGSNWKSIRSICTVQCAKIHQKNIQVEYFKQGVALLFFSLKFLYSCYPVMLVYFGQQKVRVGRYKKHVDLRNGFCQPTLYVEQVDGKIAVRALTVW